MSARVIPWPARRPIADPQVCELDCAVPPHWSDVRVPADHEPVHQTLRPSRASITAWAVVLLTSLCSGALIVHAAVRLLS